MNVLPVHRGGEGAAAQRQTGVRAAEGLPGRLLRRPGRAPGPRAATTLTWPEDQADPRGLEGPLRRSAGPRSCAQGRRHCRKRVARLMRLAGCRQGGEAVEEHHHPRPRPRPGRTGSAGTSPPTLPGSTPAGAATSPTSPPGRAGSTWPPSSTSPPGASSAAPSPITCAPSWSPTRWSTRPLSRPRARGDLSL